MYVTEYFSTTYVDVWLCCACVWACGEGVGWRVEGGGVPSLMEAAKAELEPHPHSGGER